jgi:hypothetical protein
VVAVTATAYYALFGHFQPGTGLDNLGAGNAAPAAKPPVCDSGAGVSCRSGGCGGTMLCVDGAWTECIIRRVCTPGARRACSENSCTIGYQECNPCGTGYGDCGSA